MKQPLRLAEGGRVDRSRPLEFTFNGKTLQGLAGDTLASALIASGTRVVARSFKYHRPRGIFAAGVDEPNALVQLGLAERSLPNYLATQVELYAGLEASSVNSWPSARFDLLAANGLISRFLPPGFYYKTFMWPRRLWPLYERVLRGAGGLGIAPTGPDPDRYERMNAHCDVLIVGAGPAGLAAALESGRAGARVIVIDEQSEPGGSLLSGTRTVGGRPANHWREETLAELGSMANVRLLCRTTAFGYYDHNFIAAIERVTDHLGPTEGGAPRQRIWRIRALQVVLATGAIERPLLFRNNDRPGVMLASAAATYATRYAAAPGRRAAVLTSTGSAYRSALELRGAGVEVAAIIDLRPEAGNEALSQARQAGIEVLMDHTVTDALGARGLNAVKVSRTGDGASRRINCDLLAVSGGWNPAINLHSQSGGRARFDDDRGCFVPGRSVQPERSAGSCAGTFSLGGCISEGLAAGAGAACDAGFGDGSPSISAPETDDVPETAASFWVVPGGTHPGRDRKRFVDLQTDTTSADLMVAAREGYELIEHVKRYTSLGMGTDQGRTGAVAGIGALSALTGRPVDSIGTTTFRQPYTPVTFGAIAARDLGQMFDPIRRTAIHGWHVDAGAVFEDVGQWKRPWYYPRPGESMDDAVGRECLAVRRAVGVADASTLGKIDVRGPDAGAFLNRVYVNGWTRLGIGRCRYGLMLDEKGMIFDDGVTARLSEDHYLMHTTSSGAGEVMAWLERWLQTEWPDMRVYLTSVTDHWATVSVNGPLTRRLMERICEGVDLSPDAFPFMSLRQGKVADVPARIFRISFAGELSFEINVDAGHGLRVWEAVMDAGEDLGVTPYGTETMHVLRAEKGYIIVGQDTDGSVTPLDIGAERMLSGAKDYLGRRSLAMSDLTRPDRKQLVGLLTEDPARLLPDGGQIIEDPDAQIPAKMIGHVTSTYHSPALGRSIALALVEGGRARMGTTVYVPPESGRPIPAIVSDPCFYDPAGERQRVD